MKAYDIHDIYRYTEDGGEYAAGDIHTIESNGRLGVYDFLYRIHDPANGKDNELSITVVKPVVAVFFFNV